MFIYSHSPRCFLHSKKKISFNIFWGIFYIFSFCFQYCFICRPTGIRLCRQMLGSNPGSLQLVHWQSEALTTRLDLIRTRLALIRTRLDLIARSIAAYDMYLFRMSGLLSAMKKSVGSPRKTTANGHSNAVDEVKTFKFNILVRFSISTRLKKRL
jgi:hypothetical protein